MKQAARSGSPSKAKSPALSLQDWAEDIGKMVLISQRPIPISALYTEAVSMPPHTSKTKFTQMLLEELLKDPLLCQGVNENGEPCVCVAKEEHAEHAKVTTLAPAPPCTSDAASVLEDTTGGQVAVAVTDTTKNIVGIRSQLNQDGELHDWLPPVAELWTERVAKQLSTNRSPFVIYSFIAQTKKEGKRPPGVNRKVFHSAVLAAMREDPRLKYGLNTKGQPCFWASSEEFGPTGPETETLPPSKEEKALAKAERKAARRAKRAATAAAASGRGEVTAGAGAGAAGVGEVTVRTRYIPPPLRSAPAEIIVKDTTVDIVTYEQLTRDEHNDATPDLSTAAPAPVAEQASSVVASHNLASPRASYNPAAPPTAPLARHLSDVQRQRRRKPRIHLEQQNIATTSASALDRGSVRGFLLESHGTRGLEAGVALADRNTASLFAEAALLGERTTTASHLVDDPSASEVYLNTHEPFCFATVGVQGGGKSHTMACILESCLVPMLEDDVVRLHAPMSALVLHYDQNVTSVCEATGLVSPHPALQRILTARAAASAASASATSLPSLPRDKMVVLVSPSFYRQRKAFYGDYCTVKPLLFRWPTLTADHIKRIMRIKDGDNQLYVAAMLDLLRRYQRDAVVPAFGDFIVQVKKACQLNAQRGPLEQRMTLLESLVAESDINASIRAEGADLYSSCKPGTLVIADLTDPLLAAEEANGIFQVLTEQYRALPLRGCGKLLALDEAHKFMDGVAGDGLSEAIVAVARLMRHDGMRLAVSTQSPLALAPELLELVTVAVLHRFHSRDWFSYLAKKLPLSDRAALELAMLQPGHALAFASRTHMLGGDSSEGFDDGADGLGINVFPLRVRGRITADRGASRRNTTAVPAPDASSLQLPDS